MVSGSLARRYARALIALGQDDNNVEQVGTEFSQFVTLLSSSDTLRSTLENPGITISERRNVLNAVLGKSNLLPVVNNFLRLLVDKNRFSAAASILREYQNMADELAGRVQATVTTASALDSTMEKEVKAALTEATGKQVLVTYQIDPKLIGGMVAKVGDKVFDASVQSRLTEIQQILVGSTTGDVAEA